MAHDEVFSGPMSESVPTSNAAFAHRRTRADSITSFTYFQSDEPLDQWPDEDALDPEEADLHELVGTNGDAESMRSLGLSRKYSGQSRRSMQSFISLEAPLLEREDAETKEFDGQMYSKNVSQRVYLESEDMTIVITGFQTSLVGMAVLILLTICSAGLCLLILFWVPKWRVRMIGRMCALGVSDWVVIENQWSEFTTHKIQVDSYGFSLSTVFIDEKADTRSQEENDPVLLQLRSLDYRHMNFCFNPVRDAFLLNNAWKDSRWKDLHSLRTGIDGEECQKRLLAFGPNLIDIREKSVFELLAGEAFHPFYVFQIASIILWSLDDYYYYAFCILLISVVSISSTVIETRSTMKRLREVSLFECGVRALRNGFWTQVSSAELVPGDVYEVTDPTLTLVPCDSILLSGDCILNESMLTGESVPVSKVPMTTEALDLLDLSTSSVHATVGRHFLFSGTKIIRARRPQSTDEDEEAAALAMVARTGFNTTKGALVRSMLFPKPTGFKFYRDSFRYIMVMAMIAGVGFIVSLVNFVRLGVHWHTIIIRALDLITIVVPPALPATLTIGTNFALRRLRDKQIFCISPQRVNVGGKLDLVAFDKTGTLTEDGLDVLGVRVVEQPSRKFGELFEDASALIPGASFQRDPTVDYGSHLQIMFAMATCHSLRIVNDELIGDPLDQKMFEFTQWSFDEGGQTRGTSRGTLRGSDDYRFAPAVARPPSNTEYLDTLEVTSERSKPLELGILKSFEFISQLRRASVIVRTLGSQDVCIYTKGAPECMKEICRTDSFPEDYDDLLAFYTHRGYRVIGCASKKLISINSTAVENLERQEVESGLTFVGFIVFENKLKEATTGIIDELTRAGLRKVMCTGDNVLTAISVARECKLIDDSAHCFIPRFSNGDVGDPEAQLVWESIDNPMFTLDPHTLKPILPSAEQDTSLPYDIRDVRDYSLAVTGDVFRWLIGFAPPEVVQRMLLRAHIFARMSPDEKHELVEKFQSIDYCCAFCGDGANDCGALKAADVGISLSEAEASVAAPFTSHVFDISCVPEVIREGRAALVTSFSCFKYMSMYSAIQFVTVSFLYASACNLGDFQFLFIDLFLTLPIAIFMGWAGAFPELSVKRPTAALVSRKVLVPLLGQIVFYLIIQLVSFQLVRQQPWYTAPDPHHPKTNKKNSENTTLFLISCFQYIFAAIVLSIGPPFRQAMTENGKPHLIHPSLVRATANPP